jgi:3-oxoacid CoA-transferase B subunit
MPGNGMQKEDMPGNGIQSKDLPGNGVPQEAIVDKPRLTREQIAQRTAHELPDGAYVNLGWGIPNLIASYLPEGITVYFHSENGILGMGRRAKPGEEDFDLVDAMKVPVTLIPGASLFHQADAHLMTRGGHLDVAVLGGFQVSEKGDLANWKIPGSQGPGGIGGAMDIAAGAKRLIVCMEHTTKDGAPKIVKKCTYPLTGLECVDTIVTDLAVIDVTSEGLILREVAPGWTFEEVQKLTGATLSARRTNSGDEFRLNL